MERDAPGLEDHFAELAEDEDTFGNWFMVRAADEMVTDIEVHLSMHGQIFCQTKDLPDRTKVTINPDSPRIQPDSGD